MMLSGEWKVGFQAEVKHVANNDGNQVFQPARGCSAHILLKATERAWRRAAAVDFLAKQILESASGALLDVR